MNTIATFETQLFRSCLALDVPMPDLVAIVYQLAPVKDSQTGGHHLTDYWKGTDVLGVGRSVCMEACRNAVGASIKDWQHALDKSAIKRGTHGTVLVEKRPGLAFLELRDGSGTGMKRQKMLVEPKPLTTIRVHERLLKLNGLSKKEDKVNVLKALLRDAQGAEASWLINTILAHHSSGISLEASVLPALAAAIVWHRGSKCELKEISSVSTSSSVSLSSPRVNIPSKEKVLDMKERVRIFHAHRPQVEVIVSSLLSGEALLSTPTIKPGVPPLPMLATAARSVSGVLDMMDQGSQSAIAGLSSLSPTSVSKESFPFGFTAELKYDGQRAAIHGLPNQEIRIFSRKLDDMTQKFPDVIDAVRNAFEEGCRRRDTSMNLDQTSRTSQFEWIPFILDAEIVPIRDGAESDDVQILSFQELSKRKKSNVTVENAATEGGRVKCFAFDLIYFGESLQELPLHQRRCRLHEHFSPQVANADFGFAAYKDFAPPAPVHTRSTEKLCNPNNTDDPRAKDLWEWTQTAIQKGAEGLMCKCLESAYTPMPSSKRSTSWAKLKKDYVDGLGDTLDLVPIGAWNGSGRKSKWLSPILMGCWNPKVGRFQGLMRVMSGFSDDQYRELTKRLRGFIGIDIRHQNYVDADHSQKMAEDDDVEKNQEEEEAEDRGDGEEAIDEVTEREETNSLVSEMDTNTSSPGEHNLLVDPPLNYSRARYRQNEYLIHHGVDYGLERPRYFFRPSEVWEMKGADISVSPVHAAARNEVPGHDSRGLSLRFPRFIRRRTDKGSQDATTAEEILRLFLGQGQQQGSSKSAVKHDPVEDCEYL